MPFEYKKIKLDVGYRLDLLFENKGIIEIRPFEALDAVYYVILSTHLKLSDLKFGLLINLITKLLKDRIYNCK
jgi:GxxExxY protein